MRFCNFYNRMSGPPNVKGAGIKPALRGFDWSAGFIPATETHLFFFRQDHQGRQGMGGTASSLSGFPVVIGDDDSPLSLADVGAIHEKMGCEAVSERVRRGVSRDARLAHRAAHRSLQRLFVHVISSRLSVRGIDRHLVRGKDVWPPPIRGRRSGTSAPGRWAEAPPHIRLRGQIPAKNAPGRDAREGPRAETTGEASFDPCRPYRSAPG